MYIIYTSKANCVPVHPVGYIIALSLSLAAAVQRIYDSSERGAQQYIVARKGRHSINQQRSYQSTTQQHSYTIQLAGSAVYRSHKQELACWSIYASCIYVYRRWWFSLSLCPAICCSYRREREREQQEVNSMCMRSTCCNIIWLLH